MSKSATILQFPTTFETWMARATQDDNGYQYPGGRIHLDQNDGDPQYVLDLQGAVFTVPEKDPHFYRVLERMLFEYLDESGALK